MHFFSLFSRIRYFITFTFKFMLTSNKNFSDVLFLLLRCLRDGASWRTRWSRSVLSWVSPRPCSSSPGTQTRLKPGCLRSYSLHRRRTIRYGYLPPSKNPSLFLQIIPPHTHTLLNNCSPLSKINNLSNFPNITDHLILTHFICFNMIFI